MYNNQPSPTAMKNANPNYSSSMIEKNRSSGEHLDLRQLVTRLFPRPVMYVGSYNLEAIATFIEGFAFSKDVYRDEMRDFNNWLAKRLRFARNIPWWIGLKQRVPDNKEALELLPRLFEEFWTDRTQED